MEYPKTDYRDTWEEDESGIVNELEDGQVKKIALVLMDEIKALPVERETFGLMHDIHQGNFHYDGKEQQSLILMMRLIITLYMI